MRGGIVRVSCNKASAIQQTEIVANNTGYTMTFVFDSEWSRFALHTARFVLNGELYEEVPFSGTTVDVPLLPEAGELQVGVYAGNLSTSTAAVFTVVPSILTDGEEHLPPSTDQYNAIIALIEAGAVKGKSPYVGFNGNWFEWDSETSSYVDTGIPAQTKHPYLSIERLRSYLFRVTFDEIPAENDTIFTSAGGCSSFVQDGKLHRNLDWDYSEVVSFNVRCNGFEGMAFADAVTEGNLNDSIIGQLPYRMADGCNDSGIMVSTHVLYNDWDWVGTGSTPLYKIPYIILSQIKSMDKFTSQIAPILADLYATADLTEHDYLLQFLVTDGVTTYILMPPESASGSYVCVNATDNPKLANFHWVSNNTVDRHDLQERPNGVERWNMMPCELSELRFTAAYEAPTRLSEFIGEAGTTKDSTDQQLTAVYNAAHALYEDRTRDGVTWHTMYSVVYSSSGMEILNAQENFKKNYA